MKLSRIDLKKKNKVDAPLSPVVQVRGIPDLTRLLLFVRAGGRCEFDGCPRYLMEHPVTLTEGNFAEVAHIVAFRPDGPRGRAGRRPNDIHKVENLMLLCPQCHKLIDDHSEEYTRRTLAEYKRRHEGWIKQAIGMSPDRKTALLIFTAPIGKQTVSIGYDHMLEAVAPRYPISREGLEIDLTNLLQESEAGDAGFDVIIDYLWGPPTEALLSAIARRDLNPASSRIRLIEVGESAGPTISLVAAALRSSRLEILGAGSGNAPVSPEIWLEAVRQLLSNVASGKLRIDTERVPLREVEDAWQRNQHGWRTAIIP